FDPEYFQSVRSRGQGLDFQYRRYVTKSGRGGRGFFIAPGVEGQHFATDRTTVCDIHDPDSVCAPPPIEHHSFGYLGGSLDVGGQAVLPFGLVITGSLGVHYRAVVGTRDEGPMRGSGASSTLPAFARASAFRSAGRSTDLHA